MSRGRVLYLLVVVALLGEMAFAMVTTAVQQTPTIDEPVYVATAEVLTREHLVLYNPEHPPLGKLVMAAGLAFVDPKLDTSYPGNQTQQGRHLLYETGNNPFRVMLAARLPMMVLTLFFGLVVLAFARDLAGPWAGLVALALYAFSPDIIAHGSLATLDMPAAGMLLTTFWFLWRSRRRPRLYLPLAGVALGAALATRMSALPAVPLVLLLSLLSPFAIGDPGTRWKKWAWRIAAAIGVGLIAVAVVWIVYLAVDPRLRWTPPANMPHPGRLKTLLVDLLPFPKAYRDGILIQFQFESRTFNGFLLGHAYRGSLWYYQPVALLIKTPLGMMALWLAGTLTMLINPAMLVKPALRVATLYLLVPAGALLLVAMTGARDYGTRYVIFIPVFLAVVAGTVVLVRFAWARIGTGVLVAFVAVSSLMTFPYYLPYSNEAFGGTSHTHLNLHDSNVDWGQDLARLGVRLRTKYPGEQVWTVFKTSGVPTYYGINGKNPLTVPNEQVHGLLVVSDSRVALATGKLQQLISSSQEIDSVGYSIRIYRR